jgi:hypothetical protein
MEIMIQHVSDDLFRRNQAHTFVNIPFIALNKNSVPLVRKRTIPSERPPLVFEVIANF